MLAAESAALLLLLRRRNEAVTLGLRSRRSLSFTAELVESAVRTGIADSRALSRAAGLSRLRAEAAQVGYDITGRTIELAERVRDAARARLYAGNYARLWLTKARSVDGKPSTAAVIAEKATRARLDTIGITESSEAFTRGRSRALQEARVVDLLKVWDAVLDKATCPLCRDADGTIVFARDRFPLGEPGSVHPRCRCNWSLIGTSERVVFELAA